MPDDISIKEFPPVREMVSDEEWQTRVDLAACYRLVARNGWDDLIYTHISAAVPGPDEHFLINPFGLHFHEITASSLVKVDLKGNIVMKSPYHINPAGFIVHSAVHRVRPDAGCVIHTHTVAGCGVAAQKHGLLPITQTGLLFHGNVAYHEYEGLALSEEECAQLGKDLSEKNAMILYNHGLLTAGATVGQAYVLMYFLEKACAMQIAALAGGSELITPRAEVQERVSQQAAATFGFAGSMEWAGLLRLLDKEDPSFRT